MNARIVLLSLAGASLLGGVALFSFKFDFGGVHFTVNYGTQEAHPKQKSPAEAAPAKLRKQQTENLELKFKPIPQESLGLKPEEEVRLKQLLDCKLFGISPCD
jgi:hypothetical protein